jgi:hypothetical protein
VILYLNSMESPTQLPQAFTTQTHPLPVVSDTYENSTSTPEVVRIVPTPQLHRANARYYRSFVFGSRNCKMPPHPKKPTKLYLCSCRTAIGATSLLCRGTIALCIRFPRSRPSLTKTVVSSQQGLLALS